MFPTSPTPTPNRFESPPQNTSRSTFSPNGMSHTLPSSTPSPLRPSKTSFTTRVTNWFQRTVSQISNNGTNRSTEALDSNEDTWTEIDMQDEWSSSDLTCSFASIPIIIVTDPDGNNVDPYVTQSRVGGLRKPFETGPPKPPRTNVLQVNRCFDFRESEHNKTKEKPKKFVLSYCSPPPLPSVPPVAVLKKRKNRPRLVIGAEGLKPLWLAPENATKEPNQDFPKKK